jgi:acyl-CoA reductase-like NAD-dependent aldehyde dehydrogenase
MFEAFWLPGIEPKTLQGLGGIDEIEYPTLSASNVTAVCNHIEDAAEHARSISVPDRIRAIEAAIAEISTAGTRSYQLALELIPRTSGYSRQMVAAVLDQMRSAWTHSALEKLIDAEVGDAQRLDRFVLDAKSGRSTMAVGPALTAHIFSGNVPGVAVESLIRALLVKSASFGKLASEEPVLPVLFTQALPAPLRDTVALTYWPGGTEELEAVLFREADAIVVYGGTETADSIRSRTPSGKRLVMHGPRFSVGLVGASAVEASTLDQTAGDVARAVALFDQQGCVSPHSIFVQGDFATAMRFADALHQRLAALETSLPRGSLMTADAVALQDARARAEFANISGKQVEMLTGRTHTVVIDADEPFQPSCLNRFVYVKPVRDVRHVIPQLRPLREYLQSVALCGVAEKQATELALELGRLGVSRITSFAQLPWPPLDWHHDGSRPLGELLRWVDWEA